MTTLANIEKTSTHLVQITGGNPLLDLHNGALVIIFRQAG